MNSNLKNKLIRSLSELSVLKGTPIITFGVCFFGMILSTADQALFSYAIPGLTSEFGISLEDVALILTYSFFIASLALFATGTLSDFFGRKRMFVILLSFSAFFVGLHAVTESFTYLSIFRILGFAVAAGLYPISLTIVLEVAPARYRGLFGGLLQISYPVGFFAASLFAAPLMESFGWRSIFYPAFAVIPIALFLGFYLKETELFKSIRKTKSYESSLGNKKRNIEFNSVIKHYSLLFSPKLIKRTLLCFCGTFLMALALGGITYFLPTFLVTDRGMSESLAAKVSGLSYLIGAPGYLLASIIGEFFTTRRNALIIWIWLGAVAFGFTVWFAQGTLMILLGFGATVMFIFGTEAVRMPLLGEIFPTHIRATASSIVGSLAVTLAWLTVPILLTSLAPVIGWTMAWTVCAIAPVALSGFLFLALTNYPSGVNLEELSE